MGREKLGEIRLYYKDDKRYKDGNFTLFPNEALCMDLCMGEIAVYLYLLFCEDRKTYTCHPSMPTIAKALGATKPTIKKYIDMLESKGLIYTENTTIYTKKHGRVNGNLKFTILPIKTVADKYFEKQLKRQESILQAQEALRKYEKKRMNGRK